MKSLTTMCFNELIARIAEIMELPPSHQDTIAWTVKYNGDTMSWIAKDYAPELELSIKSDITGDLVSANDSSIGLWYSKGCRYYKEVYIDTTNFILGVRGYGKKPFTIQRGHYNAFDLVTMIVDVINEIYVAASLGLYLVYVNKDLGGRVRMGCRNGSKPRFIMICDNPFFRVFLWSIRGIWRCVSVLLFRVSSRLAYPDT